MEIPTRWVKILKDMWSNKTRTLLVVFSIAIGVSAVGMISNAWHIIERDLYGSYQAITPHSVSMYISPFSEALANAVEDMREVELAEAKRVESASVSFNGGPQSNFEINVLPDYEDIEIDRIRLVSGTLPPGPREILLERGTAEHLEVSLGDVISVEMSNDLTYELTVTGIVHDLTKVPTMLFEDTYGYMTMDTLAWMGAYPYYNRLDIVMSENPADRDHVLEMISLIRDRVIEPAGFQVFQIAFGGFSSNPRSFWAQDQIDGIAIIFKVMSVLSIFLSAGLVINTISAILMQQIRQIGIMRSIGALRRQIVYMYVVNILIFSLIALLIAIPAGLLGAWALSSYISHILNFDVVTVDLPFNILIMQIATGLLVPIGAAIIPILSGTSISVYDAVYQHGLSGSGRRGVVDTILNRIRSITRPLALAFRNTFRNKSRLAYTLITLTLAGAMFISVFSSRASLGKQLDEMVRYFDFDVQLPVYPDTSIHTAEREALRIPGVEMAEGWAVVSGFVIHDDGSEGEELTVRATPGDWNTVDPNVLSGRWLEPGDTQQIVVNEDLLDNEPGLAVGDIITLQINNQKRDYEIVGIVSRHIMYPLVYMNYGQLTKLTNNPDQISTIYLKLPADLSGNRREQIALAERAEEHFSDTGLSGSSAQAQVEFLDNVSDAFNIILIVLVIMAAILAVVGGLGLAGTMSMNVLERTREIGVLRAVGASNQSVRTIVVIEGLVVGFVSWVLGAAVSYPMGKLLSDAVGTAVFNNPPPYMYSFGGMGIWLILALIIGTLASVAPAQRASNLTVREVLSYE